MRQISCLDNVCILDKPSHNQFGSGRDNIFASTSGGLGPSAPTYFIPIENISTSSTSTKPVKPLPEKRKNQVGGKKTAVKRKPKKKTSNQCKSKSNKKSKNQKQKPKRKQCKRK